MRMEVVPYCTASPRWHMLHNMANSPYGIFIRSIYVVILFETIMFDVFVGL